ncbi:MAG: hypothetical protein M3Y56_06645 [Armatimonadota bacterium]|nr:hypothetical protein [Armatimonadota bacterium]
MKQISLGIIAYAQDYDEKFPTLEGNPTNAFGTGNVPWDMQIMPLIKSAGVFKCPDDSNSAPTGQQQRSYGLNHWQAPGNGDNNSPPGQNISLVTSPATTILIAEKQNANNILGTTTGNNTEAVLWPNDGVTSGSGNNFPGNGFVNAVHNGQKYNNYAFCDGHVKAIITNGNNNDGTHINGCQNTPCALSVGSITTPNSDWGLWDINQK